MGAGRLQLKILERRPTGLLSARDDEERSLEVGTGPGEVHETPTVRTPNLYTEVAPLLPRKLYEKREP